MLNIARIFFFVYAAFTALGGLMGFIKANSKPSLIAGLISGLLLALSGWLIPTKTTAGCVMGVVVSLLLLGKFLPAYLKKGQAMPAIPMIILSAAGIAFAIAGLVRR